MLSSIMTIVQWFSLTLQSKYEGKFEVKPALFYLFFEAL